MLLPLPRPALSRPASPAYAALDLGTNACRLMIAAPTPDGFRVLESYSRAVRLGEGLQATGRLSPRAMDRAIGALRSCAARLARRRLRLVTAVATEACRQAENGAEFVAQAVAETGLPLRMITPREEAELALESCAPLLRQGARRALVFDIGGGSTELAWVRLNQGGRPEPIGYLSIPVGVVTLAERFGSIARSEQGFAAMREDVASRLVPFEDIHRIAREIGQGGVRLLGTSGTVTTIAGAALGLPRYTRRAVDGVILSSAVTETAMRQLCALDRSGLAAHPCIGPERVEFVRPGLAIFAAIRAAWPAEELVVADRGLREGLVLRMIRTDRPAPRAHQG